MEKKQLLLISKNADLIEGLKSKTNFSLEVTSVKNVHAGYTLALGYLPDAILIDFQSLGKESVKTIRNFKATHFLNKSYLILFGAQNDSTLEGFKKEVDSILFDTMDYQEIADKIEQEVAEKHCLTNYWKDSFLGLFNLLCQPVVLLQNESIVAMNDAFKKHFFVNNTSEIQLTDIVDCRSKRKVLEVLRNFSRGKHMKASTTTSLKLMNDKQREARITFSKLDRSIRGQMVMMINFNEKAGSIITEIGTTSTETQEYFQENNSVKAFRFTKREKEIIELLCKGYKTREISEALCISAKTIEKHRSNIIRRTNSDTILESVVYALNHKLIDI